MQHVISIPSNSDVYRAYYQSRELHQRYQKNAEALQERYPYTADIYFAISDNYKREAEYERKRAEDEW